jgi:hypothetical protein
VIFDSHLTNLHFNFNQIESNNMNFLKDVSAKASTDNDNLKVPLKFKIV